MVGLLMMSNNRTVRSFECGLCIVESIYYVDMVSFIIVGSESRIKK